MKWQERGLPRSRRLNLFLKSSRQYLDYGYTDDEKKESARLVRSMIDNTGFCTVFTYPEICQPILYWNGKEVDIEGLYDYCSETQTGTVLFKTCEGTLKIENVHSYYVFGEVYPGKLLPFNSLYLVEEDILKNIYVAAIVKREKLFELQIFHNVKEIFNHKNVFHQLYVDYSDIGAYKNRIPYIRFSEYESLGLYHNYMFCFQNEKLYTLDDSNSKPSFNIDYMEEGREVNWYRFHNKVLEGESINIFLHLNNGKASQIVAEYIKNNADSVSTIKNVFPDDSSINLKVTFTDNPCAVRFLYYCASIDSSFLGFAIMDLSMDELVKGTMNYRYECRFMLDQNTNIAYLKELNRDLYMMCKEEMKINRLPSKITDAAITGREMIVYMYQYLRDNFNGKYAVDYINARPTSEREYSFEAERNLYQKIFQDIVAKDNYKSKWKNEYSLYQIIKKKYSDAIYQYSISWLGRLTLDIFIPSINVAFEYQGKQHYEAVEFFGGKKSLEEQIKRDEKKRKLCKQNGVNLVEWKYDEKINSMAVTKKIKSLYSDTSV